MVYGIALLCVFVLVLVITVESGFRAVLHRMDTIIGQVGRSPK